MIFTNKFIEILKTTSLTHNFFTNIYEVIETKLGVKNGNAHSTYKKAPKIKRERLIKLREITEIPPVLHGGSGISDDDFRLTVKEGICKINIFTEMSQQAIANEKELVNSVDRKCV